MTSAKKTLAQTHTPDVQFLVASELGKMSGQMQAVLSEMSRFNGELVRMNGEMDKKHAENQSLIAKNHEENTKLLNAHKEDDEKNFDKLFNWYNRVAGGVILLGFIFTLVKWLLPLFTGAKLGE